MSTVIIQLGPSFTERAADLLDESQRASAFQRDARHFLKQLANRLRLDSHGYTITARAATVHEPGEVALRAAHMLVVVSMKGTGARVTVGRIRPDGRVAPEDVRHMPLASLNPSLQRVFLSLCRGILDQAPAASSQTAGRTRAC
jgi:hypothetical protein